MDIMFNKNDLVVYGKNGMCKVEDIKEMDFAGEINTYYVLRPMSSPASTVYVPMHKESLVSRMRSVMNKEDIDALLMSVKNKEMPWPESRNERYEMFNSIILDGNSRELLLLVGSMYLKKEEKESSGKHLSSTDEMMLKTAVKLIEEEFSHVLGCSADEVNKYISEYLK